MKKTGLRLIPVVLMLSLIIALFTGCGSSAPTAPAAPKAKAPASPAAPKAKPSTATSTKDGKIILHAAQVTADNELDVLGIALKKLKAEVEAKTNGKVEIVIHAGGELGIEGDYIEMMRAGDLAFGNCAAASFSAFTDQVTFLDTPMLFKDTAQLYRFSQSDLAKKRLEALKAVGIEPFGMTLVGGRHILTTKNYPIRNLADLKNRKIRVMSSPTALESMQALGAMPSTLAYGECYQGMQTGVIDGMENQLVTYLSMKFNEVAPNLSMEPWFQLVHILCVSDTVMKSLPAEYQQIIREAAAKALAETNEWSMNWNANEAPKLLKGLQGVNLTYPNPDELRKLLVPVHERNKKTIGEDVLQWLEADNKNN